LELDAVADLGGVGLTAVGRLRHRRARIADESRSSRDGLFGSTRSSPEGLRVRGHLAGGNRIRTFGPAEGQDRPDRYSLLIIKVYRPRTRRPRPRRTRSRRKASFDGKLLKKGRPEPPRCGATV
jgi:hypothetical protein